VVLRLLFDKVAQVRLQAIALVVKLAQVANSEGVQAELLEFVLRGSGQPNYLLRQTAFECLYRLLPALAPGLQERARAAITLGCQDPILNVRIRLAQVIDPAFKDWLSILARGGEPDIQLILQAKA
jgi:hypothetical protein